VVTSGNRPEIDRAELVMLIGAWVAPFNSYFVFHIGGLPLLIWGFVAGLVVIAVLRRDLPDAVDGSVLALWGTFLFVLLSTLLATPDEYNTMVADFGKGGMGYGDFKKRVLLKTWDFFAEAREKRAGILARKNYVEDVLQAGATKARAVARNTLDRVRHAVGLGS
jgi:hypothetical protein